MHPSKLATGPVHQILLVDITNGHGSKVHLRGSWGCQVSQTGLFHDAVPSAAVLPSASRFDGSRLSVVAVSRFLYRRYIHDTNRVSQTLRLWHIWIKLYWAAIWTAICLNKTLFKPANTVVTIRAIKLPFTDQYFDSDNQCSEQKAGVMTSRFNTVLTSRSSHLPSTSALCLSWVFSITDSFWCLKQLWDSMLIL